MKRVLVTGGLGFVGSTLCLALRRELPDAKVVALDNLHRRGSELNGPRLEAAGVEVVQGDVRSDSEDDSGAELAEEVSQLRYRQQKTQ